LSVNSHSNVGAIEELRQFLINLSRGTKATLTAFIDFWSLAVCGAVAFWSPYIFQFAEYPGAFLSVGVATAGVLYVWTFGLYRSVVRFVGLDLLMSAAKVALAAAVTGGVLVALVMTGVEYVKWGVSFFSYSLIYLCASRYLASVFLIKRRMRERENVIVYGAGASGAELVVSLRGSSRFSAVAMLDDQPSLHYNRVKGLTVYPPKTINALISRHDVKRVLLAMPSVSRRRRRAILEKLAEQAVHVQTIPDINDLVSGKSKVNEFSDIDVEDLLGRDPVPPRRELLESSITGKRVMVTGAGGSIGSELCRQIMALRPHCLVLLDVSEPALYTVNKELATLNSKVGLDVEIVPLLGSIHHEGRLDKILKNFGVQTIFHAAAYKHVPIVEHNLFEGIHNNVFGTLHTARAAGENKVEKFVLISTDKAVNPTNVMGATKRTAELILQGLETQYPDTTYCMVRFGNVLESSGSVVPLFREQIKAGGPVTVTHREIIRYFMTIPEAAQLVLQASALADGGDVFVLDMGEPVKINDLAHRMISLMGLTVATDDNPDGDIKIEYIGLRPAEKLYEELLIGSNAKGTAHPRILVAEEHMLPSDVLNDHMERLKKASEDFDYELARKALTSIVREYEPTNGIEDLVCNYDAGVRSKVETDRIIDFPKRPA
jgi:FlaA1/EpsC-like NDP-sugar epimerase